FCFHLKENSRSFTVTNNNKPIFCWDCEIPCPTLSYLISTILSTLGLRQARMDLLLSWTSIYILDTPCLIIQCGTLIDISHSPPQAKDHTPCALFPLANHLGALSHLRHSTPLVARVPFLLEGYFGLLADLLSTWL
ncbi:hypothetical protein IGI04_038240, partial [Brassica rapa subsp. trilocularis]